MYLIELILGLPREFLAREGALSVGFAPVWPGQEVVPAAVYNVVVGGLMGALLWWVYRREQLTTRARRGLLVLRCGLALLVLVLLNRPILTITRNVVEPSVLAVMVDQSASMGVGDAPVEGGVGRSRYEFVRGLMAEGSAVRGELEKVHQLRVFGFDGGVATSEGTATGGTTAIVGSLEQVLGETAGQRLAGVLVLTDGRETAAKPASAVVDRLRSAGVKVVSVVMGGDVPPVNVSVDSVTAQESAFLGDIVNVRAVVRLSGLAATDGARNVRVRLIDQATKGPLVGGDGKAAETVVSVSGEQLSAAGGVAVVELQFRPGVEGRIEVGVVAELVGDASAQVVESDLLDNQRGTLVTVVEARLAVLYVEGFPRWDFRYLRNELMRDATIDVSTLLTSADSGFAQDGDIPVRRFPESASELLAYDVVMLGDVDPRQFSDAQLGLLAEFVSKSGGGLAMLAGPRYAPQAYRGTAVEAMLPVAITRVRTMEDGPITEGFRPVLTAAGAASGVFRFFADREVNARFIAEELQPLFWFAREVVAKPGIGEVFAEHPTATSFDGKRTPLLVFGRYGAGRTMFLGMEDTWRWRFYRGESVFDTFWVQCLRELARSKKLGQRRATLVTDRSAYDLGQQMDVLVRVLDAELAGQLPEEGGGGSGLSAEVLDADGAVVRSVEMAREGAVWKARVPADRVGRLTLRVSGPVGVDGLTTPVEVIVPRLELADPRRDLSLVTRLANDTGGAVVMPEEVGKVGGLFPSAARTLAVVSSSPLWNAPVVMVLLVLMLAGEWVVRKRLGML